MCPLPYCFPYLTPSLSLSPSTPLISPNFPLSVLLPNVIHSSLPARRLVDTEDELSDIQTDSVPSEVRDWLASTFTRQMGLMLRRTEEKPRFRSIVHAVQAGIFVERSAAYTHGDSPYLAPRLEPLGGSGKPCRLFRETL